MIYALLWQDAESRGSVMISSYFHSEDLLNFGINTIIKISNKM